MAELLRCLRCGNRLQTRYLRRGVRYFCVGGQRQRKRGAAKCLNFYGADLEATLAARHGRTTALSDDDAAPGSTPTTQN